jgi:hypothetical protein
VPRPESFQAALAELKRRQKNKATSTLELEPQQSRGKKKSPAKQDPTPVKSPLGPAWKGGGTKGSPQVSHFPNKRATADKQELLCGCCCDASTDDGETSWVRFDPLCASLAREVGGVPTHPFPVGGPPLRYGSSTGYNRDKKRFPCEVPTRMGIELEGGSSFDGI